MNRRSFIQRIVGGIASASIACRLQLACSAAIETPKPIAEWNPNKTEAPIIADGLYIREFIDPFSDCKNWIVELFKNNERIERCTFTISRTRILDLNKALEYEGNAFREWIMDRFPDHVGRLNLIK